MAYQYQYPICQDEADIKATLERFGIDGKSKTPAKRQAPTAAWIETPTACYLVGKISPENTSIKDQKKA